MLSQRLANLEESATLALNAKVKALQASGQTVYNLTAGEPDCDTPAYIQKSVAKALDQNKYTPTAGLPALRYAIANSARGFYTAKWITEDNIVVTAGAKPALFAIFQVLLDPGDEVIIPSPSWVSYKRQVELAGGAVVEVPLRKNFDLDAKAIAKKISPRTKIVLINSPHNPTGLVFSAREIAKLARVVKDKPIFVLSDDIYARLVYGDDYSPITTQPFNKDRLVIINGFSKSQALTGWRIGYLIAPPAVATAVAQLLSHTFGNAPLPSQNAALSALAGGDQPPMLKDLTR
ncbi:aminotransferase class I/II-fold pyridoxal phosphate-dependent enzyme [Candidatus Saccharibacteria bacterium]|nr:aminotransferase class I/II-fold pyridoxal phosphate-dependent enzyme [Candidatus Saccharibacteria bacterium]